MKRMYSLLVLRSLAVPLLKPWRKVGVGGFLLYFIFFILSTPVFSQSPSTSFRSIPQPQLTKTLTRSYIPLSSNITLLVDNTTEKKLIIKDYLSSTRLVIDKNSKIGDTLSYYPYGTIRSTPLLPTKSGYAGQALTDKLFTGHRQLADNLSVIHAGARFYSPTLGTFIQPDTVEGPNRYGYAGNNPVIFTDSSGNESECTEGLGSVCDLMATFDSITGGFGDIASWIGDKFGNTNGREVLNDSYASQTLTAGAGLLALGMVVPDPGDAYRGAGLLARSKGVLRKFCNDECGSILPQMEGMMSKLARGVAQENSLPDTQPVLFGLFRRPVYKPYSATLREYIKLQYVSSSTEQLLIDEVSTARRNNLIQPFSLQEANKIAQLVAGVMPYDKNLARKADELNRITLICMQGGGTCRHNAPLSTRVAKSLGWQSRQVFFEYGDDAFHTVTWVNKNGADFIIDASSGRAWTSTEYFKKIVPDARNKYYYSPNSKNLKPF